MRVLYSVLFIVSVIRIKESEGGSWFKGEKRNMYEMLPRNSERKLPLGGHNLNIWEVLRQILESVNLRTVLSRLSIRYIATCLEH